MKICLYLEFYHFMGGFLYKNIGTGLLTSYRNQKELLENLRIDYTEKWDNSCDILQINTPWLRSLWIIYKARRKGKKIIIWSHVTAEDFREVFRFGKLLSPLVKRYLKYAYGLANIIFSPSEYTKSLLVAYGLPAEKIFVQSNGVNLKNYFKDQAKRETTRRQYSLSKTVVGTVGLVVPRKGVDTFLLLAKKFNDHDFVWFGKIYSKLMAQSLPRVLPPNVQFTGFVEDGCAAFNALDIFVFPSHEENQGMVLLEAAAVGLPILVRDIPVYQGWLVHEENCLKAKTDEEFVFLLERLIRDESLRNHLQKNALKLAQKESLEAIAARTLTVYQNLIK